MRILDARQVRDAVTMKEAIAAVRRGFIALTAGKATVPLRAVLETPTGDITLAMPAHIHGQPFTVVKVVSVCPSNPARDLPAITGVLLILEAETGVPLAMIDGAFLTALRTGAASGVATDLLAGADARVLGVIGAGVQARTQIAAVRAVRSIDEIRIHSLTGAPELVDELKAQAAAIDVHAVESAADALRGADVVVAATTSTRPVVHLADLSPGVHINGVGSFKPEMQEVATDVVQAARLVTGSREAALAEAGDLIVPLEQGLIRAEDIDEIGAIAAGHAPGRTAPDQITFFKSVGNAVQDAVVAGLVYQLAEARDVGERTTFEVIDPKNVSVRVE